MESQRSNPERRNGQEEYGVDQEFIVTGIRVGKLEYREGAIWGNPYLRVLRSQLEQYISDSDMDVLVVLDGPVSKQSRRIVSDNAWEVGFEAGIVVVPIVVSRERWENGPERASLLAMAVREEGVSI
jgi:hypothetical protein